MEDLPKAYEPNGVEVEWYAKWVESGCFRADEHSNKPAYSIVIPPPNVTGILHLGHVLNNTIQDILARRARQKGFEVLWLPGTDHAGIATQTRVERKVKEEEGKTRHDLGREEFLKRVWQFKDEHGGIIIKQLKRLGCSCDWSRERFTLDPDYSEWVASVFTDLFKKGLIYRGKRMVNWCPASLTALSDEEVIMKPQRSKLYYMKYQVCGQPDKFISIATTRPETLMGDVAVAVNPKDPRYADLIGSLVQRPFPPADIPVIADDHVDPEFGTGALKITPAHDQADFDIGQRHNLEIIDVLHPDGRVNCPQMPEFDGKDRFVVRKLAAARLEELGLLIKVEEHENNVGFSERADIPIEPRISMQWFLRYPQAQQAAKAVATSDVKFLPDRWAKTYAHWMQNLQDWCISRQLWWGHRIPVWYRKEKADQLLNAESLELADLSAGHLHVGTHPPNNPDEWIQDADVLDTWFSSWLWPFATMTKVGEKSPTLKKFYPTSDLVTGPDILFFWVARMIMAGLEYEDNKPFNHVFFTSIIRDIKGRKMSKSLGNSPDPLDLMAKYGADGLRFGLMRIAPIGTDIRFDEAQIEEGRNFANKLYNACRFRQMMQADTQSKPAPLDLASLPPCHLDIIAKADQLLEDIDMAFAAYRFNEVTSLLYEFFWNEYCDRFLEAIKVDFRSEDDNRKNLTLQVIDLVLERFLALLSPLMPHICEELSSKLGFTNQGEYLMNQPLPSTLILQGISQKTIDQAQSQATALYSTAAKMRNLKAEYQLASSKDVRFIIKNQSTWLPDQLPVLTILVGAKEIVVDATFQPPQGTPACLTDLDEVYMPLTGLIDIEAELARIEKDIAKTKSELEKSAKKLNNENFITRAKPEVVEQEKSRLQDWQSRLEQLNQMRSDLQA